MRIGIGLGALMVAILASAAPASAESEGWSSQQFLDNAVSWGDVTFNVGPDFIEVVWEGVVLGENTSTAVRKAADSPFDEEEKDGMVDADEKDRFLLVIKTTFEQEFSKWVSQHEYSGTVLIDNAEPSEVAVEILQADGLEGPVDQGGSISAGVRALVSFPNVDDYKDLHSVRLDLGQYYIVEGHEDEAAHFAKDLSITIQGADGWTLDESSIQPECARENAEEGRMTFTGEDAGCFTGRSGVLLAFAITGEGKAKSFLPGFELMGIAAAGLVSALVLRRRL